MDTPNREELDSVTVCKSNGLQEVLDSEGPPQGPQDGILYETGPIGEGQRIQQGEAIGSLGADNTVTKPTEPTDETRRVVLAELLADLPEADRRELIADLSPADRVAIARRLIGSGEQTANPREGQ